MSKIENAWMKLLDVRICLISKDFDPDKYRNVLMIGGDYIEAYTLTEGSPLPDHAYDSAYLKIYGFDEPFDGYAYNLFVSTLEGEEMIASGVVKANSKKFFAEIKAQLLTHLHQPKAVINALDKIIVAAFGFDCDEYEIRDEAIDELKGVKCAITFDGNDSVNTEDENFAGGLFAEVTPHVLQLCSIEEDGKITVTDEREPEDVRIEENRFAFALRDK